MEAPPPWAYYPPSPYESEAAKRTEQVSRTRLGMLLLAVSAALAWIPYIAFVSLLLAAVAAIFLVLGRKPFGRAHARNAALGLGLLTFFFAGTIALAIFLVVTLVRFVLPGGPGPSAAAQIQGALGAYFLGALVIAAVGTLGYVLFAYALETPQGKALLWAAWGVGLLLQVVIWVYEGPKISAAIAQAFATSPPSAGPLNALQGEAQLLGLTSAIPYLMYAVAYYLAWRRIARGELPAPATAPGAPG